MNVILQSFGQARANSTTSKESTLDFTDTPGSTNYQD